MDWRPADSACGSIGAYVEQKAESDRCITDHWYADEYAAPRIPLLVQQDGKEGLAVLPMSVKELDTQLDRALSELIQDEAFKGTAKSFTTVRLSGSSGAKRVALVGLGKADKIKTASLEGVGGVLAALAKSSKCTSMALLMPPGASDGAAVSKARM